jgi:hypothetical protein
LACTLHACKYLVPDRPKDVHIASLALWFNFMIEKLGKDEVVLSMCLFWHAHYTLYVVSYHTTRCQRSKEDHRMVKLQKQGVHGIRMNAIAENLGRQIYSRLIIQHGTRGRMKACI